MKHVQISSHVRLFQLLAAVAVLAASRPAAAAPPDPGPALGTNLGFLIHNSGEWPFVDAFKTSGPWVPHAPSCGASPCPLVFDADGEIVPPPTISPSDPLVAESLHFVESVGRYPSGAYTVFYRGTGSLIYGGSGILDTTASVPGRDVVIVDAHSPHPLSISVLMTDPADPIRDLRLIMPGGVCSNDRFLACDTDADCAAPGSCELFAASSSPPTFHPTFLDNLRGFRVIRFLDWMNTNEGGFVDWDQYPTVASACWTEAPAEVMAELGNRLAADLWINVPHLASDLFVESLAAELHAHLDAERKVYVEYSGEVWNETFQQYGEVTALGCDRYADLRADCDLDADPGNGIPCEGHGFAQPIAACDQARIRYTSDRSVEVWGLFASVFGGTDRIVRVLGSQSGERMLHKALLSWNDTYLETDVLATAAYVGYPLGGDPQVAGWDLDTLFRELEHVELPATLDLMRLDAATLQGVGYPDPIQLVHYESGQHLVGFNGLENDPAMNRLFDDANRDPRMGEIYHDLYKAWAVEGLGPLILHYNNVQAHFTWGRFGALEYQDQPHGQSPKYQALEQVISNLP